MTLPQRRIALPLAIGGLAGAGSTISGYLTYVHAAGAPLICGGHSSCVTVQSSEYASIGGVPVALVGLVFYLTIMALAFVLPARPMALLAVFGLSLGGALYSVYLTWVEVAVLEAICMWCVASAAVVGLLAIVSGTAALRAPDAPVRSQHVRQGTLG